MAFTGALAAQDAWTTDFGKALEQAVKEKKHVLLDFTGSDWCHWCQRLDAEVFAQDAFRTGAQQHFVLAKHDVPRGAQPSALQLRYAVESFPSVFLTLADGRPYARTGYRPDGPERYLAHLAELRQRGETLQAALGRAAAAQGVERAKALDEGLTAVDADLVVVHWRKELDEILALDADGKAGLKTKYEEKLADVEAKKAIDELQAEMNAFARTRKWDAAIERLDAVVAAGGAKALLQRAAYFKGLVLYEKTEDVDAATKQLRAAKEIAPDSDLGRTIDPTIEALQKHAAAKKEAKEGAKEGGK